MIHPQDVLANPLRVILVAALRCGPIALVALTLGCGVSSGPVGGLDAGGFVFTAAGDYGSDSGAAATLDLIGQIAPNFNLALGDLSYDNERGEDAWCGFVRARVGDVPFLLVPGNHEDDAGGDGHIHRFAECLPAGLGTTGRYPEHYYFDYAGLARFIMISPDLTIGGTHYYYGDDNEQYRWVAEAVDGARRDGLRWVIVGMHKNCISVGPYYCNVYQDLFSLLIDKKVDLVLHAHEHSYQRSKQLATSPSCPTVVVDSFNPNCVAGEGNDGRYRRGAGTVFVIVGTAGADLYELSEDDPEAGYFATWMGANRSPRLGLAKFSVSASAITGEFVGSTDTSAFSDRFVIGAE